MSNLWNPTLAVTAAINRGNRKIKYSGAINCTCKYCGKSILFHQESNIYLTLGYSKHICKKNEIKI